MAVFASAAQKDMDILEQDGLAGSGQPGEYGRRMWWSWCSLNRRRSSWPVLPDLAKPEVKKIAIGNPKTVPAGRYAMEVFNHFKIAEAIKDKLVLAENVRQVLDYVARGEVEAGLVYQTDAMTRAQEVQVVATAPADSHKPVVYPLALIKGAANEAVAREFMALVLSAQGQAVLQKYGFQTGVPELITEHQ